MKFSPAIAGSSRGDEALNISESGIRNSELKRASARRRLRFHAADGSGPIGNRQPSIGNASAFTLIEIAISLAVIGFALVAIIGVLPLGMNVQQENRERTVINQDATVFLQAISKGALGMDYLTNYVFAITNNRVLFVNGASSYQPLGYDANFLNTGARIVGLMSTPEFTDAAGNPISSLSTGNGYSNHVTAYVRSISGAAGEKPPQDNQIIRGGPNDSGNAFAYHILCVNAPVAISTNTFDPAKYRDGLSGYDWQLAANLRDLRLTFLWPIHPTGKLGNGRQTFRVSVSGKMVSDKSLGNANLFFFQPQSFTNAP